MLHFLLYTMGQDQRAKLRARHPVLYDLLCESVRAKGAALKAAVRKAAED